MTFAKHAVVVRVDDDTEPTSNYCVGLSCPQAEQAALTAANPLEQAVSMLKLRPPNLKK